MPAFRPRAMIGTLVKVDGSNLVVNALQGPGEWKEVTVVTDDRTELTVDHGPGKLADLRPGMRVSIIELPGTPARLAVVATSSGLFGAVVRIDGRNVVLRARRPGGDRKEVTVVTDEKTKVIVLGVTLGGVHYPGRVVKVDDLKTGMQVQVLPVTGTAAKIIVSPASWGRGSEAIRLLTPLPAPASGTLVKVDGRNMVVHARPRAGQAKEVTFATDDKTEFLVDGEPGKLADLNAGMTVAVSPLPQTYRRPAKLTVEATSKCLSGRLVKVDGRNVALRVRQPGAEPKEMVVATDEKTRAILLCLTEDDWFFRPKVGRLEDLKTDMRVMVLPETGTASEIIVHLVMRGGTQPASMPAPRPRRPGQVDGP